MERQFDRNYPKMDFPQKNGLDIDSATQAVLDSKAIIAVIGDFAEPELSFDSLRPALAPTSRASPPRRTPA